ncbi:MAG: proline--tRNA ligase [Gammaproteobacteria bacterium]|nr:proline--tRNA ligase [Gammaproteobacteria bacterium]
MRLSHYLLATVKNPPKDAELISHQLMIRAGLIRKVASGIYVWLPLGLRVLQKVIEVVRQEMNRIGALETLMPSVIPSELWIETGRWQKYGPELLRMKDRHDRDFCYGPTHEEVVTDLMRKEIHSYRQMPITLYQIQTKFRDEIRPRFGVMRGREFIMKDAYSFHLDQASLQKTYDDMYGAYMRIFKRLGLNARAVEADTGAIGGSYSHEFQVLADAGEDLVFYSTESEYAANIEKATAAAPHIKRPEAQEVLSAFDTPHAKTIADLTKQHQIPAQQSVKTLIVKNREGLFVALVLRGDHELNEVKAQKLAVMQDFCEMATDTEIFATMGAPAGSLGPVNCRIPVFVDRDAAVLADFVAGANIKGQHYRGINWDRDVKEYQVADLRNVVEGDISPDGQGVLKCARGIEVGHIFQLGAQYSQSMQMTVQNQAGEAVTPLMGCYGIGVTRMVASAIEQHHDERGILWPAEMAPFKLVIVPIGYDQNEEVKSTADALYQQALQYGIEVVLDDRDERPGVKFADLDLIGIPHRLVVSDRLLVEGLFEYKKRGNDSVELL